MSDDNIVRLDDWRDRGLNARQREVLRRVKVGSDCGLCGDLGAANDTTGVACLACGRVGEPDGMQPVPRPIVAATGNPGTSAFTITSSTAGWVFGGIGYGGVGHDAG